MIIKISVSEAEDSEFYRAPYIVVSCQYGLWWV